MTAPRRIYIASRLENAAAVRELRDALAESYGIGLTYDWTAHGSVQDQGEERIREVGRAEAQGVRDADLVVVLLPGGRGTHTELGIAIGAGVPVVLLGPRAGADGRECALYYCEGVQRWSGLFPTPVLAAEIARRLPVPTCPRPTEVWAARWGRISEALDLPTDDEAEARVMALIEGRGTDAALEADLTEARAERDEARAQLAEVEAERDEARSDRRTEREGADAVTRVLKATEAERDEARRKLAEVTAESHRWRDEANAELAEARDDLEQSRATINDLTSRLDELRRVVGVTRG